MDMGHRLMTYTTQLIPKIISNILHCESPYMLKYIVVMDLSPIVDWPYSMKILGFTLSTTLEMRRSTQRFPPNFVTWKKNNTGTFIKGREKLNPNYLFTVKVAISNLFFL
jgi:hypothetical protein